MALSCLALACRARSPEAAPPSRAHRVAITDRSRELGTSYEVTIYSSRPLEAQADLARARTLCRTLEAQYSEWSDASEIAAINRRAGQQGVELSAGMLRLLQGALHVSRATAGAFDVTWKPLDALWHRAERENRLPADADLAAALAAVSWQHVSLTGGSIRFLHPATQLGIAGVAKGWIIDELFLFLRRQGHTDLVVNIGGDLRAAGVTPAGYKHRVRVLDPFDSHRTAAWLAIGEAAVATSGDAFRHRDVEGRRLGHILDPRTGYPPAFTGSVTVITRDAAMADALATALFVMGPDAGLEFAQANEELDVLFVTPEGLRATPRILRSLRPSEDPPGASLRPAPAAGDATPAHPAARDPGLRRASGLSPSPSS